MTTEVLPTVSWAIPTPWGTYHMALNRWIAHECQEIVVDKSWPIEWAHLIHFGMTKLRRGLHFWRWWEE